MIRLIKLLDAYGSLGKGSIAKLGNAWHMSCFSCGKVHDVSDEGVKINNKKVTLEKTFHCGGCSGCDISYNVIDGKALDIIEGYLQSR